MAESATAIAIVGVGNIGSALARDLVRGDEAVVLAAKDESQAKAFADELGPLARAATVDDAIAATWSRRLRETRGIAQPLRTARPTSS